jgi:hypothetical protein
MTFPHIIRHGLDLYLASTALALWMFAWVLSWIYRTRKGLPTYVLCTGWVVFIIYLFRIYR